MPEVSILSLAYRPQREEKPRKYSLCTAEQSSRSLIAEILFMTIFKRGNGSPSLDKTSRQKRKRSAYKQCHTAANYLSYISFTKVSFSVTT